MKSALGLLLMQVVVPSGEGMAVDTKVEILARNAAGSAYSLSDLFASKEVRAEIERVGLDEGCALAKRAVAAALATQRDALVPLAREAVKQTIPASVLEAMHPVSFSIGRGGIYRGRVLARLALSGEAELSAIQTEASTKTLVATRALPRYRPSPDDKPAIPKVIQTGFGADPAQTFENPALLAVACLMRSPPPGNLRIESGGEVWPETERKP